jgi:hypothetical protein
MTFLLLLQLCDTKANDVCLHPRIMLTRSASADSIAFRDRHAGYESLFRRVNKRCRRLVTTSHGPLSGNLPNSLFRNFLLGFTTKIYGCCCDYGFRGADG